MPRSLSTCDGSRYPAEWNKATVHPVVAIGAASAGGDVRADADVDVGVGISDDDGGNYGTSALGAVPPEGETPPRGDSLYRSPRSAGMSMLMSRAAV